MKITSQIIGILIIIGIFTSSISQIIAIKNSEPVIETSDDGTASIQKSIGFNIKERIQLNPKKSSHFPLNETTHEFYNILGYTFGNNQSGTLSTNVLLKGFIKDNVTGSPIENAHIFNIEFNNLVNNNSVDYVYSDSIGYYQLNIKDYNNIIVARANGHFSKYCQYVYNSNEKEIWLNFSLEPNRPTEKSSINIRLYDKLTQECITNAIVIKHSIDYSGNTDWNYTFYQPGCRYPISCNGGDIYFYIFAKNYFYSYTKNYQINDSEVKTIELYLDPIPIENSIIFGTIIDYQSGEPINNADIEVFWADYFHKYHYWNFTSSNESGFYSFNIAPGEIDISVSSEGYFDNSSYNIEINENETRQIDFYLHPIPEENAIVYGLITDNKTSQSIGNAQIKLSWRDIHGNHMSNETYSNSLGFYSINVAEGKVSLYAITDGYFRESTGYFNVSEYSTIRTDISLYPFPEENSIILGFIKNQENEEPVPDAEISMSWRDDLGHSKYNHTYSDSNGFYFMNVAKGTIRLYVYEQGYFSNNSDNFYVGENDAINIDIYLTPEPEENSIIFGHVRDFFSNESIENAEVEYYWKNSYFNSNSTFSDDSGFYMMNVPTGDFKLRAYCDDYYSESSGYLTVGEYEALRIDIYLYPKADENSIVYGYLTDFFTGEAIVNASVYLYWEDKYEHSDSNHTCTDQEGFYQFNVAKGFIELNIHQDEYYSYYTDQYIINESENLRIDIPLQPKPTENSIISGYIIDSKNKNPIINATVRIYWTDDFGHYEYNYTGSDTNGYYEINVPKGKLDLKISADGYFSEYIDNHKIKNNEKKWINVSLFTIPLENSLIRGHITDKKNKVPISNAKIELNWKDSSGHHKYNKTYSDENGYYEMNVPAGEFYLYSNADGYFSENTDDYKIEGNKKLLIDIILTPKPTDNAIIRGYVADKDTNGQISNARISIYWRDNIGHILYNYTYSNENGYYEINIPAGKIDLQASADGYFTKYKNNYKINKNKKRWINFSLYPEPKDCAVIQGYIKNKNTAIAIANAGIRISWRDGVENYYSNYTNSDQNGFYKISIPDGKLNIYFSAYEHDSKTKLIEIKENEIKWLNVSLKEYQISVNIEKPGRAIYINNQIYLFSIIPIVVGDIKIKVYESNFIEYVDFYIDGVFRYRDDDYQIEYLYNDKCYLNHLHTIEVIGYSKTGSTAKDKITILKYY